MLRKIISLLCLIFSLGHTASSYADETNGQDDGSNWQLAIAIGYGERKNPLLNADDIKLALDLDIAWYGKRWFFDNGDLGFTFIDNNIGTLNTVARVNSDRVFFQKTNTQYFSIGGGVVTAGDIPAGEEDDFEAFELPKRDYALELGLEWISDGDWGSIQVDLYHDISNKHRGFHASAQYAYPFQAQRWLIEPSLSLTWKNSQVNDYYWGVSQNESNEAVPVYIADAGINLNTRLLALYQINKKWSWVTALEYEKLATPITDSPIVVSNNVIAWYSGFRYKF